MKYIAYNNSSFKISKYYQLLTAEQKREFDVLSQVFHFKANNHVLEQLIDWDNTSTDPLFKLVFPRKEMLNSADYAQLELLCENSVDPQLTRRYISDIQKRMSPQLRHNENSYVIINGQFTKGMYRNSEKIINLCPSPMMATCHAYCSYCFRWLLFGNAKIQDNSSYNEPNAPVEYLKNHPEISDVLFTGADPLVLNAETLHIFIDPILEIDSVKVIRISSKSLAWWPYRFTTDKDADKLLQLFEYIQSKGKHFNFCAHFTHPKELENSAVEEAIRRIRNTGAIIRCQGPLVKDVNDSAADWNTLWSKQVSLGMIPYYMFIEAQHNTENCFRVPLAKALQIFKNAQKLTSPLARTVRGPVFMNDIHRVLLDGTASINGEKYFVLKNLQTPPGVDGEGQIKLIPYDENATDAGDLFELFNSVK